MGAPTVSLRLFTPFPELTPIDTLDVPARLSNIEVEAGLPGGELSARFGLLHPDQARPKVYPYLPKSIVAMDKMHVEAWVGSRRLHTGVLDTVEEPGGVVMGFSTRGYVAALNWGSYENTDGGLTTGAHLIRDMVREACPWLTVGALDELDTLHTWRDLHRRSPAEGLDQLTRVGSETLHAVWDWYVAGLELFVTARVRDATPKYRLSVDDGVIPTRSYGEVYDAARALYLDGQSGERVTTWVYAPGVDPDDPYLRTTTLDAVSLSSTAAIQLAQTFIAAHGQPKVSAPFTIRNWGAIPGGTGLPQPAYLAQVGEPVKLEGYGLVVITRVSANLSTGDTQIQLGDPPAGLLSSLLKRLQQTTEAYRGGSSPVTGARVRRLV